jgi:hypothetical protein
LWDDSVAFLKNLTRFLSPSRPAPAIHLAAFGKHPAWDDHIDDLGLDTEALVAAKRLIYSQGIGQNIDSAAWDKLDPSTPPAPAPSSDAADATPAPPQGRLDAFEHEFLWHMPPSLLAGGLWSSLDGKGRGRYPIMLAAQMTDLPDRFAAGIVLPFLEKLHAQCAAASTADDVRRILSTEREQLRARIHEPLALEPLAPPELAAVAAHPDMLPRSVGFHRIVYQFAEGMAAYRPLGANASASRMIPRSEQLRLPACGMAPRDALLFWLRFALTFLDPLTPILLLAPGHQGRAYWVDLIAGEPTSANFFCIKAGAKLIPFTSDIPYTLDRSFTRALEDYLQLCAASPQDAPLPPWPTLNRA